MLKEALAYAERGWRVFPLVPKNKEPMIKQWQKKATTDTGTIEGWWSETPTANIGIATGYGSGFFVLDVDGEEGSKSLNALEREIEPLPETLEARTGTGGRHLLFKMPDDREVRNKQGFRPKLDIRGEGGYIMAAPSIHPVTGQQYMWPYNFGDAIKDAPEEFLDIICPIAPELPVAVPQEPVSRPPARPGATPVIERAALYLQECEPATEGAGGHDSLLWAARAMVIGFELSAGEALSLLWNDFNPRCSPPWNRAKPADIKDFERKVAEVQKTPGQKPRGWLLDECGLRTDDEALMALGETLRTGLLAGMKKKKQAPAWTPPVQADYIVGTDLAEPGTDKIVIISTPEATTHPLVEQVALKRAKFMPFPIDALPPKVAGYARKVAEAHGVDISFAGLPILVVASAAMGNVFRMQLKEDFIVPPTLWGGLVAATGENKSGPLKTIMAPLRKTPSIESINPDTLILNPQGRIIMSDATTEVVVKRLGITPRGILLYRSELAAWIKSFNAYKQAGGDEQTWIEFWDSDEYQLDRKTNDEEVFIPAAAVSVLGGIQPKVLVECFDPGKFASGLVPRLLITHPPQRNSCWTDAEVTASDQRVWSDIIMKIRLTPFHSLDTNTQQFQPHILKPSVTGRARHTSSYNEICDLMKSMDENARAFASKSRVMSARLALCVHGLTMASAEGVPGIMTQPEVSQEAIEAGWKLARWFLNEQLRVYGMARAEFGMKKLRVFLSKIKGKFGDSVSVRALQSSNGRRYKHAQEAFTALNELVEAGLGTWDANCKVFTVQG